MYNSVKESKIVFLLLISLCILVLNFDRVIYVKKKNLDIRTDFHVKP